MFKNIRLKFTDIADIYEKIIHKRSKRNPIKRFHIIVTSLIFIVVLINFTGCSKVNDSKIDSNISEIDVSLTSEGKDYDDATFRENLKILTETLKNARKDKKWSDNASVFKDLNVLLVKLNDIILADDKFIASEELKSAIKEIDILLLDMSYDDALVSETKAKTNYENSIEVMRKLKETMRFDTSKGSTGNGLNTTSGDTVNVVTEGEIPVIKEGERAGSPIKIYFGSDKPYENGTTAKGIKTRYGSHTYNCKTQEEYDAVMEIIDNFVANFNYEDTETWRMYKFWEREQAGEDISSELALEVPYTDVFSGVTGTIDNQSLYSGFKSSISYLESGLRGAINKDEFEQAIKLIAIRNSFTSIRLDGKDPGDGSPESAYDELVLKRSDCDAQSSSEMALLDRVGMNTAMLADYGDAHAWATFKLGKYWWSLTSVEPMAKSLDAVNERTTVHRTSTYGIK